MSSHESDSDVSYQARKRRRLKKTTVNQKKRKACAEIEKYTPTLSLDPLLYPPGGNIPAAEDAFTFDEAMEKLLPDFLQARLALQEKELERDDEGSYLRPLTRSEVSSLLATGGEKAQDTVSALLQRKLILSQERRQNHISPKIIEAPIDTLQEIRHPADKAEHKPQVLHALEDIKTTPFESSFSSRLQGTRGSTLPGLMAVDWETITLWMNLMQDIRDHYSLAQCGTFSLFIMDFILTWDALRNSTSPEDQQPIESMAPITYSTLQACHLDQVHDLLQRVFWTGIDVSDSLEYSPERCTVVACYKHLVIGVAILSSPQETYITYLAVKAGWDKAQIARTMLFHLIKMNPRRDITLHVSANNSAMLLYNQFGFKAEEFIAGFYEDYLDPASRASKNAFRLRLRQ
ncbi:hypothetical protein P691DRAFT_759486 [Macrolepiota fuliginosa MF-IS2]|uniref:N-acetyltransferase domain-containing protein n=1 Tax=Macrolepiota fuliginosa MF-IS2 TaxID=1400762 RepID=A0A9P6C2I5_9AGAR|nr:hypothetical protein P691DRAFT_759486 [Macrolepiota fuliginosa MF-IS2]